MSFFVREKKRVHAVVDVGSDAIRAFVFESSSGGGPLKPLRKFVWNVVVSTSAIRLVRKVQKSITALVNALKQPPHKITVGLGPEVAECALQNWIGEIPGSGTFLTHRDIRISYKRLFEKYANLRRAMIVAPVELLVNGYPLAWQENWKSDDVLRRKDVKEVRFMTMALFMPMEAGTLFAEIKNGFGGINIEFLPLVVAEKEAVVLRCGMRDALIVDVREDATACIAVKGGRFAGVGFSPFGTRRFAEVVARGSGRSLTKTHEMLRLHARGIRNPIRSKTSAIARETAGEWKKFFVRMLDSIATSAGPLPDQIAVLGPGAEFPEVRKALQASDWLGSFSHAERPVLRALDGTAFSDGDTLEGHLGGCEDAGLASLMVYSLYHRPIF